MNVLKKIDKSIVLKAVACALVLSAALSLVGFDTACEEIRDNVLRLHIRANSDSAEDQELKLYVRDAVLQVSDEIFEGCQNESEAFAAANDKLDLLNEVAQNAVSEKGYDYPVSVSIGDAWFETREYESFTLPAGTYEAVRINIGSGSGKNWWCVMFPALCIPSASDNDVSDALGEKQEEIVSNSDKYVVRFKVVEIFERIRNKFRQIL